MSLDVFKNASKVDNRRAEVDAALDSFTRMLAAEDIVVVRGSFQTASFDIKNRVCRIPDWQNMSHSLQVLFRAHEMGHALFTTHENFHEWVESKPDKKMFPYFNIIEDVRIERMIQAQFPGLTRSFHLAYTELMERNFFGDIVDNDMIFIDRVNVNTKLGEDNYPMTFKNDTERELYARLQFLRTFDDALQLAEDIYAYATTDEPDLDDITPESQPEGGNVQFDPSEDDEGQDQESDDNDSQQQDSDLSESLDDSEATDTDEQSESEGDDESQENQSPSKGESVTDPLFRDAETDTLESNDPRSDLESDYNYSDPIILELDSTPSNVTSKDFTSSRIFTELSSL